MGIFYQSGSCDQLNMGALACTELVKADAPNWASAKLFCDSSSSLDLVLLGDAIVCESSQQRGGGTRKFT